YQACGVFDKGLVSFYLLDPFSQHGFRNSITIFLEVFTNSEKLHLAQNTIIFDDVKT
ncbi:hypothetical protein Tco_0604969, partial [Tanacetum coccineum]